MSVKVIYEGQDITADVSVAAAWLNLYSQGHSDKLTITFGDVEGRWDQWSPKPGDTIAVEDGAAKSGTMEIVNVRPESSKITMVALSVPNAASTERRSKSWQDVYFLQLANELCNRYGLTLETYGVEDHRYDYVEQMAQPDFAFLSKRCAFEGYGLLVYDSKMVIYNAEHMDAQEPNGSIRVTPGDDYRIMEDDFDRFGSCCVTDGNVTGRFVDDGAGREFCHQLVDRMTDISEGNRFARGLLRHKNRLTRHVRVKTDSFLGQFAPGSVLDFSASAVGSWDGAAFVESCLFDFYAQSTQVEVRPVITGY